MFIVYESDHFFFKSSNLFRERTGYHIGSAPVARGIVACREPWGDRRRRFFAVFSGLTDGVPSCTAPPGTSLVG